MMTASSPQLSTELESTESPMTYTVMNPQPAARASTLLYSEIGPGLYPNEVAVTLDTGQDVAVYVEATPAGNNAGIIFYASARAIAADGATQLHQPGNVQMVTECQHASSQAEVSANGADSLAKCMAMAVLGEPIPTTTVNSGGTNVTQSIIPWDANFLAAVSIRTMFTASTASTAVTTSAVL
jgi:hypothetical protein